MSQLDAIMLLSRQPEIAQELPLIKVNYRIPFPATLLLQTLETLHFIIMLNTSVFVNSPLTISISFFIAGHI